MRLYGSSRMRKQRTSRKTRKSIRRPTKAKAVPCSASAPEDGSLLGGTCSSGFGEKSSKSRVGTSLILQGGQRQNLQTVGIVGFRETAARLGGWRGKAWRGSQRQPPADQDDSL